MGTKPNWNSCPISNFIFNFLLCSHFPNSLFPVLKGLSTSLSHSERLSPCRRLQVDCWPFWTPPWGPQPCIEREYLSHRWRTGAGDNRKSSNTVEPCVKRTPFIKRTDCLVCFKRFFLYFFVKRTCIYTSEGVKEACVASVEIGGREKGKGIGERG